MDWKDHVSNAVYLALCKVFGLSPDSDEAMARFIPAYLEDATNTQAPRKTNVVYYALSLMTDTNYDYVQVSHELANNTPKAFVQKTIPVSALLTFYGKDADNDAEMFWSHFQVDEGKGSARSALRKVNVVPIGKPSRPTIIYEVEGTYQRRRLDVRLNLAYFQTSTSDYGWINTPPAIDIKTNEVDG